MFLNTSELNSVAIPEVVDMITGSNDTIVNTIITESIEVMSSYLYKYYNTDAIFSATGNERAHIILKYLKDIVIHEVYIIRSKRMNEVAKMRYDEAMLWLEKMAKGEIEANLPKREVDTNGDGIPDSENTFMKLGGRKTYKNHW